MNFNTKITREGLSIPKSAAKASSFASWEDLRGHALPQAIVVLKKQMTGKDMLLKEAIEDRRAEDARAARTFGTSGGAPQEV